jgi:hypothetical protein
MSKGIYIKVNGELKTVKDVWIKKGDILHRKVSPKAKINGNLKNFMSYNQSVNVKVSFLQDGAPLDDLLMDMEVTVSGTVIPNPESGYPNLGIPTALDATILAYSTIQPDLDGLLYNFEPLPPNSEPPGYYVTRLWDIVPYDLTSDAGYTWVLLINKHPASILSSNAILEEEMVIDWDFRYVEY